MFREQVQEMRLSPGPCYFKALKQITEENEFWIQETCWTQEEIEKALGK